MHVKKPTRKEWVILILSILSILEFSLFYNYAHRNILGFFPANFDQSGYLAKSYQLYENIQHHHFSWHDFKDYILPTSSLFIYQTVLMFIFFGASRLMALSSNFFMYVFFQWAGFFVVKNLTSSYRYSFIFLALLLSLSTPFFWAGGLFDFRIDFLCLSAFGIFLACVLQSKIFLNRFWSVISALVGVYLINLRLITLTYLIGIFSLYFVYILFCFLCCKKTDLERKNYLLIINHILIFALIISMTSLSLFYFNWQNIYNYYFVGHLIGNEKNIRMNELGIQNLYQALLYYPKSLFISHLGSVFLFILGVIFTYAIFGYLFIKTVYKKSINVQYNKEIICFLSLAILLPFIVLNLDASKTPVVINILVPPILFLSTYAFYCVTINFKSLHQIFKLITIFVFLIGFTTFTKHFIGRNNSLLNEEVNRMYKDISKYVLTHSNSNSNIIVGADHISDFLIASSIEDWTYEQTKKLFPLSQSPIFGLSIFELNEKQALASLTDVDIFFINQENYPINTYPSDVSLEKIKPKIKKFLQGQRILLGKYRINGQFIHVYIKPNIITTGFSSDGWIDIEGFQVHIPKVYAKMIKKLCFYGNYPSKWLTRKPGFLVLTKNNNELPEMQTIFKIKKQSRYELCVFIPNVFSKRKEIVFNLKPDSYFVPKNINIGEDTRLLVIYSPDLVKINE